MWVFRKLLTANMLCRLTISVHLKCQKLVPSKHKVGIVVKCYSIAIYHFNLKLQASSGNAGLNQNVTLLKFNFID